MVGRKKIEVYGLIKEAEFYQAKVIAEIFVQKHSDEFCPPLCIGMIESNWIHYIEASKKKGGGELWSHTDTTLVLIDGQVIGAVDKFLKMCQELYDFEEIRPLSFFRALAKEGYKEFLKETNHDFVYMDIVIGKKEAGRLLFELHSDMLPKTCENFKQLSLGERVEKENHQPPLNLTYKNSILHRVVKNGWVQGGDIVEGKGNNGWSIYGETFEDENYSILHSKRGIIGMANKGRHTNASQFYITLQPCPWMDCQYVAFGELIEGVDVLDQIEAVSTYNERPLSECLIVDCGLLDITKLS